MTRQKGKHRKRNPGWHTRGPGPARAFSTAVAMFARLEPTGVDVTEAGPVNVLRGKQKRNRGEAK